MPASLEKCPNIQPWAGIAEEAGRRAALGDFETSTPCWPPAALKVGALGVTISGAGEGRERRPFGCGTAQSFDSRTSTGSPKG